MEKAIEKISKDEACWYAVYTAPQVEEKIKKRLEQLGFECYLPLQSFIRVWANHKRKVMVPVLPRIVFVRLSEADVHKIADLKDFSFFQKKEGGYLSISSDQLKKLDTNGLEAILLEQ